MGTYLSREAGAEGAAPNVDDAEEAASNRPVPAARKTNRVAERIQAFSQATPDAGSQRTPRTPQNPRSPRKDATPANSALKLRPSIQKTRATPQRPRRPTSPPARLPQPRPRPAAAAATPNRARTSQVKTPTLSSRRSTTSTKIEKMEAISPRRHKLPSPISPSFSKACARALPRRPDVVLTPSAPYIRRDSPQRASKAAPAAADPLLELDPSEDGVYEVAALVDKKVLRDGKVLYKVRWKGYSADYDTWEPREHLSESCSRLLQNFEIKQSLGGV